LSGVREEKKTAINWIDEHVEEINDFLMYLWRNPETALREYKAANAHRNFLTKYGLNVEMGIAGMPTAFMGTYGTGRPAIGTLAEYDATPEQSQDAVPYPKPIVPNGPGFSDAHNAIGVAAAAAVVAVRMAMEKHKLKGKVTIFGTPAEKVEIGKPYQAAKGYYDGYDAFTLWHPGRYNSVLWETQWGSIWCILFTFQPELGKWIGEDSRHYTRHPGALDAVTLMYTITKFTKEYMLPPFGGWSINEYIMIGGQATGDNLPPGITQIQYAFRSPSLDMQETIYEVLENNAKAAALATKCKVTIRPITKTRVGLFNKVMAELMYRNLELIGPPKYDEEEREFARQIQRYLGYETMKDPFDDESQTLTPPWERERIIRQGLPPKITHAGSDDYVEFTWHAPTARLRVAYGTLRNPPSLEDKVTWIGESTAYPHWVRCAFNGTSVTTKLALTAAKTIACSIIELLTMPSELKKAQDEFKERTGGGIGGSKWVPPLLPKELDPPIDLKWPEWIDNQYPAEPHSNLKWHIPY
jgi:aminobenzoyl-glutamate utilization protein B